jgi:hypothetical protein
MGAAHGHGAGVAAPQGVWSDSTLTYMLPQSDFNTIDSGTNDYSAGAGYNLVTGLGTPVANLLVPDLGVPGGWHDL